MAKVEVEEDIADEIRQEEEEGSPFHQNQDEKGVSDENCHGPSFQKIHLEGEIHHDPCHRMEILYVPGEKRIYHQPPEVEGGVPGNENAHLGAIFHWNSFQGERVNLLAD